MLTNKEEKTRRPGKQEREAAVLLALVAQYIKTGKPVGSETLRDLQFHDLSSATIRNYLANMETAGLLTQQHVSGGRLPTDAAFRIYAKEMLDEVANTPIQSSHFPAFHEVADGTPKALVDYLERIVASISDTLHLASFASAPRFDQDFVTDIRFVGFDSGKVVVVLLTNFGLIHTEILYSPIKISAPMLQRIENYCRFRLSSVGTIFTEELNKDELEIAHKFYQESIARYLVRYSNFIDDDVFRAGFSALLHYEEFRDPHALTSCLSIFENRRTLYKFIHETMKTSRGSIKYWCGTDLSPYVASTIDCAVATIPFTINQKNVGVLGILGPLRLPYKDVFQLLCEAADTVSISLTNALYKHRISFRRPSVTVLESHRPLLLMAKKKE